MLRTATLLAAVPSLAFARPAPGDYHPMTAGAPAKFADVVQGAPADLPNCLKTDESRAALAEMFTSTYARLVRVALTKTESSDVVFALPSTGEADALQADESARTDSAVIGYFKQGDSWKVLAVLDPAETLHERVALGIEVRSPDGHVVCGDVLVGIAYHQDPPKPKSPPKKRR